MYDIKELIINYCENNLSIEDRKKLNKWLEKDHDNKKIFAQEILNYSKNRKN